MSNLPTKICPNCDRNPIEEDPLGMCYECFDHEVDGGNLAGALVVVTIAALILVGLTAALVLAR